MVMGMGTVMVMVTVVMGMGMALVSHHPYVRWCAWSPEMYWRDTSGRVSDAQNPEL